MCAFCDVDSTWTVEIAANEDTGAFLTMEDPGVMAVNLWKVTDDERLEQFTFGIVYCPLCGKEVNRCRKNVRIAVE